MVTLYLLWLGQGWANARAPQTAAEWWLFGILVGVGTAMTVGLMRPLARAARLLEQSKKPRGERGWALLERLLPAEETMGLSLRGQDLRGMDLKDAFLADIDLSDTDLRGVDLSGANLEGAYLAGACYDAQTRWPENFDPGAHRAVEWRSGGEPEE
jgi:hypothetical protein